MEIKRPLDEALLTAVAGEPLLSAYVEINHLKQLFRQGWLRVGVPRAVCESVAEHTFAMTILAWMAIDSGLVQGVDRDRVLRMILVHEMGEVYAGDLTPSHRVAAEEKQRQERESIQRIAERVPSGKEWLTLWEEFEAGESAEAQLVRQLDRLEMAFQAMVYQHGTNENLDAFMQSARQVMKTPALARLLDIAAQTAELPSS